MNSTSINYGGNLVDRLTSEIRIDTIFNTSPYYYAIKVMNAGEVWKGGDLGSATLYALEVSKGNVLACPELEANLEQGDSIQAESSPFSLKLDQGQAMLLVSGTASSSLPASLRLFKSSDFKRVEKPWGHELWINGEHPGYAFKQIFVKASKRLSLQYHRVKTETQLLVAGRARLHYQADMNVPLERVRGSDVASVELTPICVTRVSANVLHRIEALTDTTIYETSTPHLDDVVRVEDDTSRPDGRINSEHYRQ